MSYFAPYLDGSGLHLPTYQEVVDYLVEGYKGIFGQDAYMEQESPDYQLMSLYARAWDDLQELVLDAFLSHNPDYATGMALDSLLALNGIRRRAATASTVTLELTGIPSTTIDAGQIVRDANGYEWSTDRPVELDNSGKGSTTASCTTKGAILADPNTITIRVTPTYNWISVTNPAQATVGQDAESDASVRVRRAQSVSRTGSSSLAAIHDSLFGLDGVTGVRVIENSTNATDSNGIPAHSVCCVVDGGNTDEIAKTIFGKKAPGIGTHGSTSVTVTDLYGNDNTVKFEKASRKSVPVAITITPMSGWQTSQKAAITAAVTEYIQGIDIGETLVVPALYSAIYGSLHGAQPTFVVTSLKADNSTSSVASTYKQKLVAGSVTFTGV